MAYIGLFVFFIEYPEVAKFSVVVFLFALWLLYTPIGFVSLLLVYLLTLTLFLHLIFTPLLYFFPLYSCFFSCLLLLYISVGLLSGLDFGFF